MKALDRFIQRRRIARVLPHVRPGDRLLDIGCSDGVLFEALPNLADGIGIDPFLDASVTLSDNARLIKGWFPADLPDDRPFNVVTLMAVLEHIPPDQQVVLARDCAAALVQGGHLIITVPSPQVDTVLAVLKTLRLIDGMSLHEHYGFDSTKTGDLFTAAGLRLIRHTRFQFGLNNFFLFEKP